jgi:hypothetical protein
MLRHPQHSFATEFPSFQAAMDEEVEYMTADIPEEFKALRACLRCSLIKTFEQVTVKFRSTLSRILTRCINVFGTQFNDKGCENCEFIDMEGNKGRIEEVSRATSGTPGLYVMTSLIHSRCSVYNILLRGSDSVSGTSGELGGEVATNR